MGNSAPHGNCGVYCIELITECPLPSPPWLGFPLFVYGFSSFKVKAAGSGEGTEEYIHKRRDFLQSTMPKSEQNCADFSISEGRSSDLCWHHGEKWRAWVAIGIH